MAVLAQKPVCNLLVFIAHDSVFVHVIITCDQEDGRICQTLERLAKSDVVQDAEKSWKYVDESKLSGTLIFSAFISDSQRSENEVSGVTRAVLSLASLCGRGSSRQQQAFHPGDR